MEDDKDKSEEKQTPKQEQPEQGDCEKQEEKKPVYRDRLSFGKALDMMEKKKEDKQ